MYEYQWVVRLLRGVFLRRSVCHRESDEVGRGDPVKSTGCDGIASACRPRNGHKGHKVDPVTFVTV